MKKYVILMLLFNLYFLITSCGTKKIGTFVILSKDTRHRALKLASKGKDTITVYRVDEEVYFNKNVGDSVSVEKATWNSDWIIRNQ